MNILSIILTLGLFNCIGQQATINSISKPHKISGDTLVGISKLLKYYPQIKKYKNNRIYFGDGSSLVYKDSSKNKTFQQLLDNPDLNDQFKYAYVKGKPSNKIEKYYDPGRIRNEKFFRKIYGNSKEEVRKNLVEIVWCPKLINGRILITRVNGIDQKVKEISAELDEMPEYKEYLKNIGGTFSWRLINGTNRLSMHSFGMTIDINTSFSNYWQWDCKCLNEDATLGYKNKIPQKIIDVFEKHGFIWGGKWYHYDTMHFEYRPELIDN